MDHAITLEPVGTTCWVFKLVVRTIFEKDSVQVCGNISLVLFDLVRYLSFNWSKVTLFGKALSPLMWIFGFVIQKPLYW